MLTAFLVASAVYLAIAATVGVIRDPTVSKARQCLNLAVVWAFPVAGALFAFREVPKHAPEALPRAWIVTPLRPFLFARGPHSDRQYGAQRYSQVEECPKVHSP